MWVLLHAISAPNPPYKHLEGLLCSLHCPLRPLYYILIIIIIQISIFFGKGKKIEKTKLRTSACVYCFIFRPSLEKYSYSILTFMRTTSSLTVFTFCAMLHHWLTALPLSGSVYKTIFALPLPGIVAFWR